MAWWQELVIQDGGVGGQGTLTAVQSATRPAAQGNVLVVNGPFPSKAAALGFTPGGTPEPKGASTTGQGGISSLFPKLSRQDLLRLAEGVLGILLILVGVAKLAEGSPVAKAVGKAGLLA